MHANLVYQIDVQKERAGRQSEKGLKAIVMAALHGGNNKPPDGVMIVFGASVIPALVHFGAILYTSEVRS